MDEKKDLTPQNTLFISAEEQVNQFSSNDSVSTEITGDHNLDEVSSWLDTVPEVPADDKPIADKEDSVLPEDDKPSIEENTSVEDSVTNNADNADDSADTKQDTVISEAESLAGIAGLAEEEKKRWSAKKKLLIILGIVFGVVVIAYAVGCVYYSSHFFNRARLNDLDVANSSVEAVVDQLKADENNYVLTLEKRDKSKAEIKGKDVDLKFNDNGAVQEILETQHYWEWPRGLFEDTQYNKELSYQFDDTKVQKSIDALALNSGENVEPAVNAHPAWQNGKVEIVPEVYGNTIIPQKLNEVVRSSLKKGEKKLELTRAGAYETPKFLSNAKEVAEAKKKMEEAVKSNITYTIDDLTENLDVNTFGPWLICDANMAVTVNQEQGAAYLATLGQKYDTSGGDYSFTTSGGSSIVISGGTFGWAVDEANELPKMTADILSGQAVTRPITSKGAASRTGSKEVGKTYVEISLGGQHMWLYVDGNLVIDTPVVTGGPGHRTPSGVFKIESHSRDVTLRGDNGDGTQYASYVNYWMPFYHAEGDGIHDADGWRSSYGGDIYNYNGSHGCVNTPLSAVSVIYNNTSDGCPVVIY